jgi:hypothetical protein
MRQQAIEEQAVTRFEGNSDTPLTENFGVAYLPITAFKMGDRPLTMPSG